MQIFQPEGRRPPCLPLDLRGIICDIIRQFDLNLAFSVIYRLQGEPAVPFAFNLESGKINEYILKRYVNMWVETTRPMLKRWKLQGGIDGQVLTERNNFF